MPANRCHILLVDDHADSAMFMAKLLKLEGHTVLIADCCASARALAEGEKFDLLISDIGLPDGTGYELMGELGRTYGLRGIALSGRALPEDVDASREAGFVEHLIKPVSMPEVAEAISRIARSPAKA
jgi:CheY-like chemotaxis protein